MEDDEMESFFPTRDGKIDWSRFWFTQGGPISLHCWDNEPLTAAFRERIRDRLAAEWQRLTPAEQKAARDSSKAS